MPVGCVMSGKLDTVGREVFFSGFWVDWLHRLNLRILIVKFCECVFATFMEKPYTFSRLLRLDGHFRMSKSAENASGNEYLAGSRHRRTCANLVSLIVVLVASTGFVQAVVQENSATALVQPESEGEVQESQPKPAEKVDTEKSTDSPAGSPDLSGEKPVSDTNKAPVPDDRIDMLNADLTKNWKVFSTKSGVAFGDVWKLVNVEKERHLICLGEPKGFLYKDQRYDNFEMTFEWKYAVDPNGNSGVLVFTNEEPRLWPTSMQIQLHQPRAGSVFPSGDATSDSTTEATDLALEIGNWNSCRVVAVGGRVSVEINGKPAGEVSGCKPFVGSIALQSEGSETHFRRMFIRKLPATTTSANAAPADPVVEPKAAPVNGT